MNLLSSITITRLSRLCGAFRSAAAVGAGPDASCRDPRRRQDGVNIPNDENPSVCQSVMHLSVPFVYSMKTFKNIASSLCRRVY